MDRRDNVVWILGAGFSKALGGPLLPELLSSSSAYRVAKAYPECFKQEIWQVVPAIYEAGSSRSKDCFQPQWEHAEEFLERLDIATSETSEQQNLIAFLERLQRHWTYNRHHDPDFQTLSRRIESLFRTGNAVAVIRTYALKILCAECSVFVNPRSHSYERWIPYVSWASRLRREDTVLTFNYDCVPETLSKEANPLWIPDPSEVSVQPSIQHRESATVLKLHGSLCWQRDATSTVVKCRPSGALDEPSYEQFQHALSCLPDELAIAVPGPSKRRAVDQSGYLHGLWKKAGERIQEAEHFVFVGYRIPPSDAYTRNWLFCELRRAAETSPIRATIVLGADERQVDVTRVKNLLLKAKVEALVEPLFAEDFLDVEALTSRVPRNRNWHPK